MKRYINDLGCLPRNLEKMSYDQAKQFIEDNQDALKEFKNKHTCKWITGGQRQFAEDQGIEFTDDVETCQQAKVYIDKIMRERNLGAYGDEPPTQPQLDLLRNRLRAEQRAPDEWPPATKAAAHELINKLKNGGSDRPASDRQKEVLRGMKIPGVTEERLSRMTQGEASKLISGVAAAKAKARLSFASPAGKPWARGPKGPDGGPGGPGGAAGAAAAAAGCS